MWFHLLLGIKIHLDLFGVSYCPRMKEVGFHRGPMGPSCGDFFKWWIPKNQKPWFSRVSWDPLGGVEHQGGWDCNPFQKLQTPSTAVAAVARLMSMLQQSNQVGPDLIRSIQSIYHLHA